MKRYEQAGHICNELEESAEGSLCLYDEAEAEVQTLRARIEAMTVARDKAVHVLIAKALKCIWCKGTRIDEPASLECPVCKEDWELIEELMK